MGGPTALTRVPCFVQLSVVLVFFRVWSVFYSKSTGHGIQLGTREKGWVVGHGPHLPRACLPCISTFCGFGVFAGLVNVPELIHKPGYVS